jgi:S1-C subfamily serine protease
MKLLTNSRILDSFWRHWVTIALVSTLRLLLLAPQIHAADGSETAGQIRDANLNSIVFISVRAQRSNGLIDAFAGTGFIVHPAGYVVTCNHVVPAQNSDYIHIEMTGSVGGRYKYPYPLTIVRRDEQGDVILLKLPEDEVWHNVRSAGEGHIGSDIITFGFPFEQDLLTVPGSITGVNNDGKWITNASLNSGMSGGPAFDRSGNVVGIVAGGYNEASAINLLLRISSSNSDINGDHADNPFSQSVFNRPFAKPGPSTVERNHLSCRAQPVGGQLRSRPTSRCSAN